jgi:hypothetical protein
MSLEFSISSETGLHSVILSAVFRKSGVKHVDFFILDVEVYYCYCYYYCCFYFFKYFELFFFNSTILINDKNKKKLINKKGW